jgi:hypothetical protein
MMPSGIDGLAFFAVLREVFNLVLANSDILPNTEVRTLNRIKIRA